MTTLPEAILMMLIAFIPVFSQPTWKKNCVLIVGSILCFNHRTVAACLRVMGLDQDNNFSKYHQVLNRARWSGLKAAQILLGLLLRLVPRGFPVIIGVDETIERRKGNKIKVKGCYRDAVKSSRNYVVKCFGLKWICFALIVPLPWSSRPWALPFLTLLQPSKKYCREKSKTYLTSIEWTLKALKFIRRQLKSRDFTLLTDGGFTAVYFIKQCSDLSITLIGRLKINAALYDFPAPQPKGKKGPKPKKGKRLPSLKQLAEDPAQPWKKVAVSWCREGLKNILYLDGVCLWYTPVQLKWVLVIDDRGTLEPHAFFSNDASLSPLTIISRYMLRWSIETTLQEVRRHLGMETQRQWSEKAIQRTTPALLGIFSLVCLMAKRISKSESLSAKSSAWYKKRELTFSDIIAAVRRSIWSHKYLESTKNRDNDLFNEQFMEEIIERLSYAA